MLYLVNLKNKYNIISTALKKIKNTNYNKKLLLNKNI